MLDCHEYLAKRGWKGKGTALRSGGIAKPINVTQKRTLSGLGKDRDEAFPFWEHVYDASISAVNIKVHDSDTDSEGEEQVSLSLQKCSQCSHLEPAAKNQPNGCRSQTHQYWDHFE